MELYNDENGEGYHVAGMDDRDFGYLVDNRLIHHQWERHEPIDGGSDHCGPGILVRHEDLVPTGSNGYNHLKGDDTDDLYPAD